MDLRTKALQEGITTNSEEIERWTTYKNDHEQAAKNLEQFEKSLEIEIMVPIGTKALMPGKMYHTNEVLVSHSNEIFSKCSSFQAKRICRHRIDVAEKRLKDLDNERDLYQNKLDLPFDSDVFSSEGQHEIIEDYDEEKEKQWREEHKKRVRESKQRELAERALERHAQIAESTTEDSSNDKNDFEMLDELELMEELDNELETLNIDNMDDDRDYVNKLMENMQSESNSSTGNNKRISSYNGGNKSRESSNDTMIEKTNSLEITKSIETTNNLIEDMEINKSSKILNDNQLKIVLPEECKDNGNNNNNNKHSKNETDDINQKNDEEEEHDDDNDYEYEDDDDDDDDVDDEDEDSKTDEYRRLEKLCENYTVEKKIDFYTKHLERVEKELPLKSHSLELFNLHDDLKVVLEHLNDIILTDKYLEQLENDDGDDDGDIKNNNSDLINLNDNSFNERSSSPSTPSTPSSPSDFIDNDDDDDNGDDYYDVENPEEITHKRKISFGEENSIKKFYSYEEPFKLYDTTGLNSIQNHNNNKNPEDESDDSVPLISRDLTLQINFQHSDKKYDSTKYDDNQEDDNILIKTPSHIYIHYAHCMKMTAAERKQKNDLKEFVMRIANMHNNNNNNSSKDETTTEKSTIECGGDPIKKLIPTTGALTDIPNSENDHQSDLNNSQTKSILKNKEAVKREIHMDNEKKEESDGDDEKHPIKYQNSMKANNRNKPTFYYDPKDEATILDNDQQTENDANFIEEPTRKISLFKASRMKNK